MTINKSEYKNARLDKGVSMARWDRLCRWWLDVEETGEITTISEFAREFGVAGTQLSGMVAKYKKLLQSKTV